MKYTNLPEKWCIFVTKDNCKMVNTFFLDKQKEYKGLSGKWTIKTGINFCYPQHSVGAHSTSGFIPEDYTEISTEQLTSLFCHYEIY